MKTGLCSITFRQLTSAQIVELAGRAGLDAIEWGGDVHVPPGNRAVALETRRLTEDAGLRICSYGSYFTILDAAGEGLDFQPVLETALALGANAVRIWAGCRSSDAAGDGYRERLVEEAIRTADRAAECGVKVALEFHRNTLTDTNDSAVRLLQEVGHSNLYTYWQPVWWGPGMEYRMQGLERLRERVLNLHVFHWVCAAGEMKSVRRPLSEGAAEWKRYCSVPLSEGEHFALLEFVRDNEPDQLLRDAAVLRHCLAG